ncbi:hypothetical protein PG995_002956 [Apiospora arundinis]
MLPTATPLLLVNRQLHSEVQDAVARLPAGEGKRCKMDLMFLDETELWVTPLEIPSNASVLDQVDVTIRIVGVVSEENIPIGRSIWDWGRDRDPACIHPFYYALERFLRAGPTGRPGPEGAIVDRHIVVKHLVLNFTTTTPDDHHPLAPLNELGQCKAARTRPVRAVYAPYRSKLMRPEWLVFPLFSYLKRITSGRMDDVKYGRLLMERVGVISVQVFGRPYKKLDVAKRLDEMEFEHDPSSPDYEEARAFYLTWRKKVFAARAVAGLA